jgi:hypothetical protein
LPLEEFVDVRVDGVSVDPKNYTLKSGSTLLTFAEEYLDYLAKGQHAVEMDYGDGLIIKTNITVKGAEPVTELSATTDTKTSTTVSVVDPKDQEISTVANTGDSSHMAIPVSGLAGSVLMAYYACRKKIEE